MTGETPPDGLTDADRTEFAHALLLAVAGQVPDQVIADARERGAESPGGDIELLARSLSTPEKDVSARQLVVLAQWHVTAEALAQLFGSWLPAHRWEFAPLSPEPIAPERPQDLGPMPLTPEDWVDHREQKPLLDLTGLAPGAWPDDLVPTVLGVASRSPGLLGIWGGRRSRAGSARSEPVFLVEAESTTAADTIARALPAARVEAFRSGEPLPRYHRRALASAALLWAARPAPPALVPVFDGVDGLGVPQFAGDHPRLDAGESEQVAHYLSTAETVLPTAATMVDVLDGRRGRPVPLSYRTDGRFVWPDAVLYYVQEYSLAPYGPLLQAIRRAGYRPPAVNQVGRFLAGNVLRG